MIRKLFRGENTFNFYGRRRVGFIASCILALVSVGSLVLGGLNLGIDFRGGVAFEVPAKGELNVTTARDVLNAENVAASGVKIQTLTSATEERVRIQLGDQTPEVVESLKAAFAEKAGVASSEISVDKVSSSWGRSVSVKALQALLVFFVIVSLFIAWRFEWQMAVGAFASVIHDIVLSVGVYSLLQIEVTPATVTAFLTIMGYSLYDTIVIFDKMSENEKRFSATKASYGDVINVSMNSVLMRSVNTSISSILPVVSLLLLGAGILGARALSEFAVALFIGMLFGAYSSIFIAAPVVGLLKERSSRFISTKGQISVGADMAHLIASGAPVGRRAHNRAQTTRGTAATEVESPGSVDAILSHPPRPRKKSRR
jgi:preprotein translocase subunit SecF